METQGILVLGSSRGSAALAELLEGSGEFSVHVAGNAASASQCVAGHDIAVCIWCDGWTEDWLSAGASGQMRHLALLQKPLDQASGFPVHDVDESLACPVSLFDLLTSLRSLLRKHEQESGLNYMVGSRFVDSGSMQVEDAEGRATRLTRLELKLLNELYRNAGSAVTRAALLQRVWGYGSNVQTATLDTHIYSLRQKLENDPGHPAHIVAAEGGYRLDLGSHPHRS